MQLRVYFAHYIGEVFFLIGKVAVVYINDEQGAIGIAVDPFVVKSVEPFQIIEPDILFVFPAAFLYLVYQCRYGSPEVDEQIGWLDECFEVVKEGGVVLVVALGHQAHIKQVGSEDAGIFINSAVLYHTGFTIPYFYEVLDAVIEKVYLQVEGPAGHVFIKINQVWVVFHIFKMRGPLVLLGEHAGKRGFAGADVAGNGYMFDGIFWWHLEK